MIKNINKSVSRYIKIYSNNLKQKINSSFYCLTYKVRILFSFKSFIILKL